MQSQPLTNVNKAIKRYVASCIVTSEDIMVVEQTKDSLNKAVLEQTDALVPSLQ